MKAKVIEKSADGLVIRFEATSAIERMILSTASTENGLIAVDVSLNANRVYLGGFFIPITPILIEPDPPNLAGQNTPQQYKPTGPPPPFQGSIGEGIAGQISAQKPK